MLPSPTPDNPYPKELCLRHQEDGVLVAAEFISHAWSQEHRYCAAHLWPSDQPSHPIAEHCERCR